MTDPDRRPEDETRPPSDHGPGPTDVPDSKPASSNLSHLRDEIERLDTLLLDALARRVRIAQEIGAVKREAGSAVLDPRREATVVRRAATLARERGLPEDEVRQIYWLVVGLTRRTQIQKPGAPPSVGGAGTTGRANETP